MASKLGSDKRSNILPAYLLLIVIVAEAIVAMDGMLTGTCGRDGRVIDMEQLWCWLQWPLLRKCLVCCSGFSLMAHRRWNHFSLILII